MAHLQYEHIVFLLSSFSTSVYAILYLDQTGASPLSVGRCCGGSEPPQQELAEISNSV